jgi:FdrA protein
VVVVASVTGTPDDPQDSRAQTRTLEEAGIVVAADNRAAAALAAEALAGASAAPPSPRTNPKGRS